MSGRRIASGLRIGLAYLRARRAPRFESRAALEHWQDGRVRRHLDYVLPRSPYYRSLFAGRGIEEWRTAPVTDKRAMMAHFDRFNTVGVGKQEALAVAREAERSRDFRPSLRGLTVGLSSGTSGAYSLFLSSPRENDDFVGTALARLLRGSPFRSQRIAFLHRADSNLYGGLATGRLSYRFFDLLTGLERHCADLEAFDPTVLIGPPFALRRLGEALRAGRLRLRPRELVSVAEVLEDREREAIAADFGAPVGQAYVATEGFVAATCARGSLHVNEDLLVVQREWLDRERGRFVPVLTDFRRRVQPILRYRLDDVLVEGAGGCGCGSPFAVLERVEGRCDDVLVLPSERGSGSVWIFPDFVRRAVGAAFPGLRDYRVVQETPDRMLVELAAEEGSAEAAQAAVTAALAGLFRTSECAVPGLRFEPLADARATSKERRVQRAFEVDWRRPEAR